LQFHRAPLLLQWQDSHEFRGSWQQQQQQQQQHKHRLSYELVCCWALFVVCCFAAPIVTKLPPNFTTTTQRNVPSCRSEHYSLSDSCRMCAGYDGGDVCLWDVSASHSSIIDFLLHFCSVGKARDASGVQSSSAQ
jgi:hypothetical protein